MLNTSYMPQGIYNTIQRMPLWRFLIQCLMLSENTYFKAPQSIYLLLRVWKIFVRTGWTWTGFSDWAYQICILTEDLRHQSCFWVSATNINYSSIKRRSKVDIFIVIFVKRTQNTSFSGKASQFAPFFPFEISSPIPFRISSLSILLRRSFDISGTDFWSPSMALN